MLQSWTAGLNAGIWLSVEVIERSRSWLTATAIQHHSRNLYTNLEQDGYERETCRKKLTHIFIVDRNKLKLKDDVTLFSPEPYKTYQKKVDGAYQEFYNSDRNAFYEALTARVRQVYNRHQDYSLAEVVCGCKQVPAGVVHRQLETWVKDMENKKFYSKNDCKLDLQEDEEVPARYAAHRASPTRSEADKAEDGRTHGRNAGEGHADGAGADHETAKDEDEVTRLKALLKARDNQIARMHEEAEEDRFIRESDNARLEQDVRALQRENTQLMAQLQKREPIDLEVLKREGMGGIFKGKFGNEARGWARRTGPGRRCRPVSRSLLC